VTGVPQIQKDTDAIRKDLAKIESSGKADPTTIDRVLQRIDFTLKATEIAIRAEARQMARERHGRLMQAQSRNLAAKNKAYAEVGDLEKMLEAHGKGEDTIPKGFTADEIRDRVSDLRAEIAKLAGEDADLRARMKELEDLLAQEVVPPVEETLLTREREALTALRTRAEALRGG
jgi:hypothetical protein